MTICIRNSTEAEIGRKQTLHYRANFKGNLNTHTKKHRGQNHWCCSVSQLLTLQRLLSMEVCLYLALAPVNLSRSNWVWRYLGTQGCCHICSFYKCIRDFTHGDLSVSALLIWRSNPLNLLKSNWMWRYLTIIIGNFTRLKAFYNLTKNIQCTNTHNYTDQRDTSIQNIWKLTFSHKASQNSTHISHVHTHTHTHTHTRSHTHNANEEICLHTCPHTHSQLRRTQCVCGGGEGGRGQG